MSENADSGAAVRPSSEALFEQHRDRIYRYIRRLTRDPAEAEDLTQETFLRAHRRLTSLQDAAAAHVWLYRIATHVCYDRFRRASLQPPPESLDAPAPGESDQPDAELKAPRLDQLVEQAEMSACVQGFLEKLSDDYRLAILLHDIHGLTNAEIARMTGCSLDTIKIRLHRARRKLKAALAGACEFSSDKRGVLVCQPKLRRS